MATTSSKSGAGSRYVEVRRETLETYLQSKGFVRGEFREEVVYTRNHHINPHVHIRVYTSLSTRGHDTARGCGHDAIKVSVFYDNGQGKSFGIGSFPHVYRTGSEEKVVARMYERMVAAYTRANEWVKQNRARAAQAAGR